MDGLMALVSVNAASDDFHPPFRPVRVLTVEITQALPVLVGGFTRDGVPYGSVRTLVTFHDEPLGLLDHDLAGGDISAGALAHAIYAELGAAIDGHLRRDGHVGTWTLESDGLSTSMPTSCRALEVEPRATVSVVLATTGDLEALDRSLDSLLSSEHRSFEVMVLDRGSLSDGTKDFVDDHRAIDRRVRYFAAHGQCRSAARNAAFGLSRGQVVAFTDEGCVASPGWIRAVAATFERHPDAACVVGPVLTSELETPPQLAFESMTAVTGGWQHQVIDRLGPTVGPGDTPFLAGLYGSGDNIAVQKGILDDLWGFDPNLGPSSAAGAADDLDVMLGMLAEGHQIVFEPRALVWRRHPSDVATVRTLLRNRSVGLGAMLTKQMLVGHIPRRELLRRLAPLSGMVEPSTTGPLVAHLTSGVWAYTRSRAKSSWMTA
jgi:glycosyltransferase involved in cell wall biosynthesis